MTFPNPDLSNICLETWDHPVFRQHSLRVEILRLDKIHPEISGNKWFKLKYYLEKAQQAGKKKLISFGGPYSNHLLALAAAACQNGFTSVGMIRGEKPASLSHTLVAARAYGMELCFLSRQEFDEKKNSAFLNLPDKTDQTSLLIPEGGSGEEGLRGAAEILSGIQSESYTHICTAAGTGTTLAGLINCAGPDQKMIGVSVLKGTRDFGPMDTSWIENKSMLKNVTMIHEDHFGGYAKSSKILIDFMNRLYADSGIPTDFVYTGKLFFSVQRMAGLGMFPALSQILILHTGGLQGNRSLKPGMLQF